MRRLPLAPPIALLAMLALAGPAPAQPAVYSPWGGPDSPGGIFGGDPLEADMDRDQRVTPDEFWTWLRGRATGADPDRDGLTAQELGIRPRDARRQAWFRAADADGNGRLSLDEIELYSGTIFRFHDADRDNALTRPEVAPRQPRANAPAPGPAQGPAPAR
jgi:hypothetical protein